MLSLKNIQEIIEKIANSFNPEQIVLFGSYAEGKAKEDSDLDLLVVMETDLPDRKRYPVVRRILAGYPIAFDLIIKTPEEYERARHLVNHIVYFADKYGKKLYVRHPDDWRNIEEIEVREMMQLSREFAAILNPILNEGT